MNISSWGAVRGRPGGKKPSENQEAKEGKKELSFLEQRELSQVFAHMERKSSWVAFSLHRTFNSHDLVSHRVPETGQVRPGCHPTLQRESSARKGQVAGHRSHRQILVNPVLQRTSVQLSSHASQQSTERTADEGWVMSCFLISGLLVDGTRRQHVTNEWELP